MLRYASSHRSHLIGLSLIGLLALAILLFVQAPSPVAPAIQPPEAVNDAASGAMVDPLANVNPADRKFYTGAYVPRTGFAADVIVPANVDPADRKFYTGVYAPGATVPDEATAPTGVDLDPPNRRFHSGALAPGGGMNAEPAMPAGVHPADRKFFFWEVVPDAPR